MCQVPAKDVEDNSEVSTYIFSAEFFMDVFNISFQGAKVSSLSNVLRKRLSQFMLIDKYELQIYQHYIFSGFPLFNAGIPSFLLLSFFHWQGIRNPLLWIRIKQCGIQKKIIAAVNARFSFLFLSFYYFGRNRKKS